jgi:NAD(P)-dependent dehydrogenase (short-subunit alcohol dehydrogenase family)
MSTITQDNFKGQRALVTGATSGIGRAVALELARDGAEVLVHGRDAARGAQTVQEITAAGGAAHFVAADLGDSADVQRLASDIGEVDVLINNAGMARWARTAEFDAAAFDKMFVSVSVIAPGPVYTSTPSGPEFIRALGETTPMHRASQPEEIAEVIAFLASPRASYITGATVAADGGRRAI